VDTERSSKDEGGGMENMHRQCMYPYFATSVWASSFSKVKAALNLEI
jgi:hypothetical protein